MHEYMKCFNIERGIVIMNSCGAIAFARHKRRVEFYAKEIFAKVIHLRNRRNERKRVDDLSLAIN